jgi:hypothetical protein
LVLEGLLDHNQPNFGSAIEEIWVELNRRAPSRIGLPIGNEKLYSVALAKLPRRRYEKAKRRFTITALSVLPGEEPLNQTVEEIRAQVSQNRVQYAMPTNMFDQLRAEFDDVVQAFENSPPKLKSTEFNWPAFVVWFRELRHLLPKSEAEIQLAINAAIAARHERTAALDPWERLEINWKQFHPKSRHLLNDPWFWDNSDDFAPNGNDDGSDVLDAMLSWHRRNKSKSFKLAALERLAKRFCYDLYAPWRTMDSFDLNHRTDFIVGVAFAHIKLRGGCPEWLVKLVRDAWAAVSADIELGPPDWKHKDEKLASIARLRQVLNEAAS